MSYRLIRKDGTLQIRWVYPNNEYEPEAPLVPTGQSLEDLHSKMVAVTDALQKPVLVEGADGKLEPEKAVARAKEALAAHRRGKPWL